MTFIEDTLAVILTCAAEEETPKEGEEEGQGHEDGSGAEASAVLGRRGGDAGRVASTGNGGHSRRFCERVRETGGCGVHRHQFHRGCLHHLQRTGPSRRGVPRTTTTAVFRSRRLHGAGTVHCPLFTGSAQVVHLRLRR